MRPAGRAVADTGDLGLVGHQADEREARPRDDLARECHDLGGGAAASAWRRSSGDRRARASRRRCRCTRGSAVGPARGVDQVEVRDGVDHHRHTRARRRAPAPAARLGRRWGRRRAGRRMPSAASQSASGSVKQSAIEPRSLERALDQHAAAQRLARHPDRRAAGTPIEVAGVVVERVEIDHREGRVQCGGGGVEARLQVCGRSPIGGDDTAAAICPANRYTAPLYGLQKAESQALRRPRAGEPLAPPRGGARGESQPSRLRSACSREPVSSPRRP